MSKRAFLQVIDNHIKKNLKLFCTLFYRKERHFYIIFLVVEILSLTIRICASNEKRIGLFYVSKKLYYLWFNRLVYGNRFYFYRSFFAGGYAADWADFPLDVPDLRNGSFACPSVRTSKGETCNFQRLCLYFLYLSHRICHRQILKKEGRLSVEL